MPEFKDTSVKLFGWTITSSSSPVLPVSFDDGKDNSSSSSSLSLQQPQMMNNESVTDSSEQDNTSLPISSDLNKESKETSENSDDQHSEITTATTSEEKTTELKKPDKILPCPRCNSADTKFCYYNNYNVNQPRHFCRNCQRYWTSGGSMRTVPFGSGRRKNKGWVSSDHYSNSSTKILSFESSESVVTENGKHQTSDVKINADSADSVTQEFNNFQGFLPPQVTSPVSPPWPYQYPPNPSFYHIPVYWGCTVPVWSTLETSTCLGKRTRDEASVATMNHVWYPMPMKREKTEQSSFFVNGSETKSSNKIFVPETYPNLQANPAAMTRSMNFRESM